jgi:hypothetical protein
MDGAPSLRRFPVNGPTPGFVGEADAASRER